MNRHFNIYEKNSSDIEFSTSVHSYHCNHSSIRLTGITLRLRKQTGFRFPWVQQLPVESKLWTSFRLVAVIQSVTKRWREASLRRNVNVWSLIGLVQWNSSFIPWFQSDYKLKQFIIIFLSYTRKISEIPNILESGLFNVLISCKLMLRRIDSTGNSTHLVHICCQLKLPKCFWLERSNENEWIKSWALATKGVVFTNARAVRENMRRIYAQREGQCERDPMSFNLDPHTHPRKWPNG